MLTDGRMVGGSADRKTYKQKLQMLPDQRLFSLGSHSFQICTVCIPNKVVCSNSNVTANYNTCLLHDVPIFPLG